MYDLDYTTKAWEDLCYFRKYDQRIIQEAVETRLAEQPASESRQRKRLRPNGLAEWELRVGNFRVFYDVLDAEQRVKINSIGYKQGNQLFVQGEEHRL